QKQAARQVSVSNSISSLRFLNNADWRTFVETESIVEKILHEDPDAVYGKMDFYTRDHYRHVVEKIAKYSALSEEAVAKIAIRLAQLCPEAGRKKHVGYYLVSDGVKQVEKIARVNMPITQKLRNHLAAVPLLYYFSGIGLLSFLFFIILAGHIHESLPAWQYGALLLACIVAASQPAIALFNWIATLLTRPDPLPRMDFSSGIPKESSTLVVIPTMLTGTDAADSLAEALEVRYVANRDDHLHFALLTDFKDAETATLPEDEALLAYIENKIRALNEQYGRTTNDVFMLFHRPRKWNPRQGVWMGHERKRGKLKELNALLRGKGAENFSLIVADRSLFAGIKYIITLDTDTRLPREAAWKMAASLAHPLNSPQYNPRKKRVTEGYTILQPRVSNSLPGPGASWYARIHGNEPGIDPYTRMISDVYQDLFNEGSFIGKGIYEVDTFTQSLSGRFPENRILSHDLVEGCYARSGFLSDVQLYEAYPQSYYADMQRRHRWIRGDWQILRWLFPLVPAPDKRYRRNPLSTLSRWKIFDNIRRSLVAPALLLLLLYGWVFSPGGFWTIAVAGIILIPSLIKIVWELFCKPKDIGFYPHLLYMTQAAKDQFLRHLPELVFLPYEAFVNLHAIVITAWRIFISKRNLLQWNPYGNSVRSTPKTLSGNYLTMWVAPVFAAGILIYLLYASTLTAIVDLPVLISWILSPGIAYLISKPRKARRAALDADQTVFLRKLSRRIWAFFEKFVTDEDNWLPPDNYQKQPGPKIAHRTSPTNIGLSLLANLTAYDFGYISAGRLIDRTTRTFRTIQELEKYKGHLYNWYDTITLSCLQPRYISTVDSGNFIGHIITLKQGLLQLKDNRIFSARMLRGLSDTVALLLEKKEKDTLLQELKKDIEAAQSTPLHSLREIMATVERLKNKYYNIVRQYENAHDETDKKTREWLALLGVQLNDITGDLITLAPWLSLQPPSPAFHDMLNDMDHVPTLTQLCNIQTAALPGVKSFYRSSNTAAENNWLDMLVSHIIQASGRARERLQILEDLAGQCDEFSDAEYDFLYSKTQHLLAIGYNAEEHRLDNSYYDLLASEARLGNFVAIAQGKLPQESWFALGRQLTNLGSAPALLSWSGSMFEYLMPELVMPSYENTLLDQTHKAVVQKQIDYGNKKEVPWGISESGYNMIDAAMNYQYKAFGVPGTGFKRGLGEDLVISPYSSVMALMVMPEEACSNLQFMAKKGFTGTYGFFEAIDYTPS
ncbi:MAG TPA: glucoamylase family protein, partial [Agriterribacter sp.]|nr:glucoamylase family protein [Agriterribacter sp.]